MKFCKLLTFLLFICSTKCEQDLVLQVSEDALNYGAKMGSDILSFKIPNINVPDYSGTNGAGIYNLKNITVLNSSKSDVAFKIQTGQGLYVKVSNATMDVGLNWDYQLGSGWLKIKDVGQAVVSMSSITATIELRFLKESTGAMSVSIANCNVIVEKLDTKVFGKLTALYVLYTNLYKNKIKSSVESMICEQAIKLMSNGTKNWLSNLNYIAKVDNLLAFNYTLLDIPTFGNKYMQTKHAGDFYAASASNSSPRNSTLFNREATPVEPSKMLRASLSENVLVSAANALIDLGFLEYSQNLTLEELAQSLELNTNSPIILDVKAGKDPIITIDEKLVNVSAPVIITVSGMIVDKSIKEFLKAEVNVLMSASVSIINDRINGTVVALKQVITIKSNQFKGFTDTDLISMIESFVENSLPEINVKLGEGFLLPMFNNLTFKNSTLLQQNHFFVIDSDFAMQQPLAVGSQASIPVQQPLELTNQTSILMQRPLVGALQADLPVQQPLAVTNQTLNQSVNPIPSQTAA